MTGFELYVFFLCLIVFVALTTLFSFLIVMVTRQRLVIVGNGLSDEKIKRSLIKKRNKRETKIGCITVFVEKTFSVLVCLAFCLVFIVTLISGYMGNEKVGAIPAIKVVASTSMSERYERNEYLFKNGLTDQLQLFDVVLLRELPPENEIELYDIVVYEHISGTLLLHRIVGIEEPNEEHPNERYFLLQGDAVHYPDSFPVRYSQMKSVYCGEKIPNVGSFVYFMQSPAGMICLILVIVAMILMPIVDYKVEKAEYARALVMVRNEELTPKDLRFFRCYKQSDVAAVKKAVETYV